MVDNGGALTAFAPAKINLTLHLCGQRADGYHLLDSLVVFPGIGDRLSARPAKGISLNISGPFSDALEADEDNLVIKAARLLAQDNPRRGAALSLEKHLPIASGIGGGSTDCAAALAVLSRLWDVAPPSDRGLSIGADVPVCCAAPAPQRMRGIGEKLDPLAEFPAAWIVLVNPGLAVPTGAVFSGVTDKSPAPGPHFPKEGFASFQTLSEWLRASRNDLEASAVAECPEIGTVLAALSDAPLARMSGSGATCFALYPDRSSAETKAAALKESANWWVVSAPIAGTPG